MPEPKPTPEPYSIVRAARSGVWAGHIIKREHHVHGLMVTMIDARRLWAWKGAASLSELAERGTSKPDECTFPAPVGCVEITEVIEIIRVTDNARKSIASVKIWTA